MPLELGIWRIDSGLQQGEATSLDGEARLEDILHKDISIASPNWMIIGRQVLTHFGKYVDLLAIDPDGQLIVLELKRDKTYRDIVAQTLDYGSWVRALRNEDIARIFDEFLKKYHPDQASQAINDAFCQRFGVTQMPDELNDGHQLVIVASSLDGSTERIVTYLSEEFEVPINAIFFRVFRDGDREYLTRAWLRDPTLADTSTKEVGPSEAWNGEFYVSFGVHASRRWEDALQYGFISAGGGSWYINTLGMLEPGARVWVNVPSKGYVGVGEVTTPVVKADQFLADDGNGKKKPLSELPLQATEMLKNFGDDTMAEHVVGVKWLKTVPLNQAIHETGFFGNQNTVARPKSSKWRRTVERLKQRFGVS